MVHFLRKVSGSALYIVSSYVLLLLFVWDYASSYQEFFATFISLERSSVFWILLANATVASMLLLWYFLETLFFGTMTLSESTIVYNAFTVDLFECVLIPLYVDYSIMSLFTVVTLLTLVFRLLHRLAKERVTTMGIISNRFTKIKYFIQLQLFILFAASIDLFVMTRFANLAYMQTSQKLQLYYTIFTQYWQMFLITLRVSILLFLGFYKNERTPMAFYTESVLNLVECMSSIGAFSFIWFHTELPYIQVRTFVASIFYAIKNMSDIVLFFAMHSKIKKFPLVTAGDLEWDSRCTICYEDMVVDSKARRLPCGHCYHEKCLTQWFEQHSTCPYCRANLLHLPVRPQEAARPPETEAAAEPPPATATPPQEKTAPDREELIREPFDVTLRESFENLDERSSLLREYHSLFLKCQFLERELSRIEAAYSERNSSLPLRNTTVSEKSTENRGASSNGELTNDQVPAPAVSSESMKVIGGVVNDNASTHNPEAGPLADHWMRLAAFCKYHDRLKEAQRELHETLASIDELRNV